MKQYIKNTILLALNSEIQTCEHSDCDKPNQEYIERLREATSIVEGITVEE